MSKRIAKFARRRPPKGAGPQKSKRLSYLDKR
jgi:hypothetical protein